MQRPISPTIHGVIDYATTAAVVAAPRLMRFPKKARMACDALAGSYTSLSAMTDYPLSVRRTIPFKAHGATEAVLGLALPALPWALGFAKHKAARNFFIGLTAPTSVVASPTRSAAADQ